MSLYNEKYATLYLDWTMGFSSVSNGSLECIFYENQGYEEIHLEKCTIIFDKLDIIYFPAAGQIRELADKYRIGKVKFKDCLFVQKDRMVSLTC